MYENGLMMIEDRIQRGYEQVDEICARIAAAKPSELDGLLLELSGVRAALEQHELAKYEYLDWMEEQRG